MAYGLYSHIQSNKRRSIALLIGLFFLVYVMTFAGALMAEAFMSGSDSLDYIIAAALRDFAYALPWVTIGTLIWMFIAYRFHQSMIDAVTGGHEVTRQEQPRLYNLLENLCISRGITMPKLKVMDSPALNAFATGLNEKQYSITVTSGLLERLDDPEVEAVLAHELTHIRNGDVRMLVIAVVIAGVLSFVAELTFRLMFQGGMGMRRSSSSSDKKGGAAAAIIIAVVLIAVAWILSIVIRFALSRKREYLADAGSVELTKNPDAMITALRKIENRGELEGSTSAVMEMCFDNPRSGFADLFATHPPIDKRVQAIVQFAGGRDPGVIALPGYDESDDTQEIAAPVEEYPQGTGGAGPYRPLSGTSGTGRFLPDQPPVELGGDTPPPGTGGAGPWSPKRGN
jgi:heat shock protein HtpX